MSRPFSPSHSKSVRVRERCDAVHPGTSHIFNSSARALGSVRFLSWSYPVASFGGQVETMPYPGPRGTYQGYRISHDLATAWRGAVGTFPLTSEYRVQDMVILLRHLERYGCKPSSWGNLPPPAKLRLGNMLCNDLVAGHSAHPPGPRGDWVYSPWSVVARRSGLPDRGRVRLRFLSAGTAFHRRDLYGLWSSGHPETKMIASGLHEHPVCHVGSSLCPNRMIPEFNLLRLSYGQALARPRKRMTPAWPKCRLGSDTSSAS